MEGTIIYTFNQQKGRGQRGSNWLSEPFKNIAFSLILHPVFLRPDEQFLLSKTASLAVADLMAELLPKKDDSVKVKWPNDIYVNDKKIAGILVENVLGSDNIQTTIIGIGLNVNQNNFSRENFEATSLKMLSSKESDLQEVLTKLCGHLEARYLQLKAGKRKLLDNDYLKCLYRLNEWKSYSAGESSFEGKITNVSPTGKLQLELRDASIREFDLKELVFS
jgi:BirA family transcriptional regulator, biotin operon repressor / biotin---[acetyl-CoA-carboxylase] ligase